MSAMFGGAILALVVVTKHVLRFVGVSSSSFTPYVFWFTILTLFGALLPKVPERWSSDGGMVEGSAGVPISAVVLSIAAAITWVLV